MGERGWVVALEVAATGDGSRQPAGVARALEAALSALHAIAYDGADRYLLRLRVIAGSEAEALFVAAARWRLTVKSLGLPAWTLARAEVVTGEEAGVGGPWTSGPARWRAPELVVGDDLLRRALHDSLTGLMNRELFRDRLRVALAADTPGSRGWAVLVCDLDHFAGLNRSAGPAGGDRLLVLMASRITTIFARSVVGRLGGDSFALLTEHDDLETVSRLGERLLDAIRAPVDLDGRAVAVTASVGVAVSSALSHPDDLLRHAATAMCVAKSSGGDCVRLYDPGVPVDVGRLDADSAEGPDTFAFASLLERAANAANDCATLEDAAAIVLRDVCDHTGWPLGHLGVINADGDRIVPTATWHVRGADRFQQFRAAMGQITQPRGEGLSGRVLQSGATATVDIASSEAVAGSAAGDSGAVSAGFAFPVLIGTEVVAVLEFYSAGSVAIDESLGEVMGAVGAQLGRIVERDRARAALARSEQRYRTLSESAPVLMWMSDTAAQCTFCNAAWLEFTGRPLEAELGDGWAESVHPEDLERRMDVYARACQHREPFEVEYRLRRADGEYRWVLDKGHPVGAGDQFQGYVGACIDVSDRRRAETDVGNIAALYQALIETSGTTITMLARDGSIIDLGSVSGLGYPAGSTGGHTGFEYLHPDDLAQGAAIFEEVVAAPGVIGRFECRVRAADGTWRWVEAVGRNLLDYPPLQAIVMTSVDITEKKQLQAALAEAHDKLRARAKANHRSRTRRRRPPGVANQ